MKKSMDFSKIEINGKLLGVLNFNLMIHIEEEQLQLVDTTIFKRDRENIKYYKREPPLSKQLPVIIFDILLK